MNILIVRRQGHRLNERSWLKDGVGYVQEITADTSPDALLESQFRVVILDDISPDELPRPLRDAIQCSWADPGRGGMNGACYVHNGRQ